MSPPTPTPVTVLGLGAMGTALAHALIDAGHPTTVWNRSADTSFPLAALGAVVTTSVDEAVSASPVVVVCLFDHASVHDVLDSVSTELRGRFVVNLTTTTPDESRELGAWAGDHGIDYLDGGIMAVPEMIGGPGSSILYSGSSDVADQYGAVLDVWGEQTYLGPDPGLASLQDLAMLAGMYVMFAGFFHGAAMVSGAGVTATDFAIRATPFLAAMTDAFGEYAAVIDGGDYAVLGQQSLEFSDLTKIVRASVDEGVNTDVLVPVHQLIQQQIEAGYGKEGFARIFESLRGAR